MYVKKPVQIRAQELDSPVEIRTNEGTSRGKKGDYLVIGVMGEKYIVGREIFQKTYERVGPERHEPMASSQNAGSEG